MPGLQGVPADAPVSAAASVLAETVLSGETTVSRGLELVAEHFSNHERVDGVVAALTTFAPDKAADWLHLGQRAWLREWLRPGTSVSLVPGEGAGPEAALTMPWMSQVLRHGVAVIPDAAAMPPEADQDRRELAQLGVSAVLGSSQVAEGTMFGSLSVVSESAGVWPEHLVADLRLLSASLTSRMSAEQAKRSLADAIALGDQARANQEQFFAAIGHELRTPISAILGFAEVLIDEAGDHQAASESDDCVKFADVVSRDTGVILRAGEQLLAIVEDLLSTGRTLGAEEVRTEQDVAAAVDDIIHWLRTPALANQVTVTASIDPDLYVHVRPSGLRQVLTNLVGNAIIHNQPGGTVQITAERSMDEGRVPRVRIKVRDTGRGLEQNELAQVFEPFVRFAGDDVKGTGLGLPLARAVAERDGGLVGAESAPGEGSVFWVDLPVG